MSKYINGIFCNIELSKIIYPDWICRIYCSYLVDQDVINRIGSYEHVELYIMNQEDHENYLPVTWRFLPNDDQDVSIFLSRDADSRLSYRERKCVSIFEDSDKIFHSIRDDGNHDDIMAGMFGIKKNNILNMKYLLSLWPKVNDYGSDQFFLRQVVKPLIEDKMLTHCSTFLRNFPEEPINHHFVGQVFPEDNMGKPENYIFY